MAGLCVTMPVDSEEKFKALIEGETKHYNGDQCGRLRPLHLPGTEARLQCIQG